MGGSYQFQFGQVFAYSDQLLQGLWLTITLSAQAIAISFVIGVLGALVRTQGGRIASALVGAYVEIIRNTPFLVQAFFIFFGLPSAGIRLDPETAALIALSLNGGAYLTEIVRAGISSIPKGQIEAGRALGLGPLQIYRYVVLAPALKAIFPAMTAEFIVIFLATSVCSIIAVDELTATAINIDSQILRSFEIFSLLLAVYLGLSILLSAFFALIEHFFLRWGDERASTAGFRFIVQRLMPGPQVKPVAAIERMP